MIQRCHFNLMTHLSRSDVGVIWTILLVWYPHVGIMAKGVWIMRLHHNGYGVLTRFLDKSGMDQSLKFMQKIILACLCDVL